MSGIGPREKSAGLRLARSRGIGPVHAARLIERFGSAEAAIEAVPRLAATGRWGEIRLAEPEVVAAEEAAARRLGAQILVHGEPGFPLGLAAIPDPPMAITLRGRLELLEQPAVAIVGARNASANGRVIAQEMARELAAAGIAVVSGLARGIDTAAHRGAVEAGGATIAVVAGGADIAYPEENAELMATIAEQGIVLSERALGAVPRARDFPRRNRLIAGLSIGIVVIEAAPQSGSLITARLALEQGREVMAVPGSPLDPRHRGTNQLLRDGATLVETAADVLDAVAALIRRDLPRSRPRPARRPGVAPSPRAAPAFAPSPEPTPIAHAGLAALPERVRRFLGPDPLAVDELVRQCQASVAAIQDVLLELELEGRLERHPGNRVSLRVG
jgi:DNA processing protein